MKLRLLTLAAMFAALCAIGAFVKIPVGIGSAALDTIPALVSAAFLPSVYAGAASMIGHLSSSLYAGFPLGPLHIIIAGEMFLILFVFTKLHRAGLRIWKWIFFVFANSVLATLPFYWIISPGFFVTVLPEITIATVLNAGIAIVVSPLVERVMARVKTHA
ncbi:ECF transporter S component [Psychrobacillus sp. NPDC058041]|uniref:ECF transporter S component n=1 Tax=Psychrobacillus sp. NPDC058041 TaxID=3346310 RepID=UPI0036D91296